MNKAVKNMLLRCHPDRHGGDHSLMERVYRLEKPTSNSMNNKKYCWCGARIGATSKSCNIHWRTRRLIAALLLVVTTGCGTVKKTPVFIPPTSAPPSPMIFQSRMAAAAAPQVKTNGVVTLAWDNGEPPETFIVNQTSGVVTAAGTNEIITLGGLRTGTNTFIATNINGSSLPVSALIAPDTARMGFHVFSFIAEWPGGPGVLQSSTNLVIWKDERDFPASGILLVTNILTQPVVYYRVRAKP